MLLYQLVQLSCAIENKRKILHKEALENGVSNLRVLKASHDLDRLIISYQQIRSASFR